MASSGGTSNPGGSGFTWSPSGGPNPFVSDDSRIEELDDSSGGSGGGGVTQPGDSEPPGTGGGPESTAGGTGGGDGETSRGAPGPGGPDSKETRTDSAGGKPPRKPRFDVPDTSSEGDGVPPGGPDSSGGGTSNPETNPERPKPPETTVEDASDEDETGTREPEKESSGSFFNFFRRPRGRSRTTEGDTAPRPPRTQTPNPEARDKDTDHTMSGANPDATYNPREFTDNDTKLPENSTTGDNTTAEKDTQQSKGPEDDSSEGGPSWWKRMVGNAPQRLSTFASSFSGMAGPSAYGMPPYMQHVNGDPLTRIQRMTYGRKLLESKITAEVTKAQEEADSALGETLGISDQGALNAFKHWQSRTDTQYSRRTIEVGTKEYSIPGWMTPREALSDVKKAEVHKQPFTYNGTNYPADKSVLDVEVEQYRANSMHQQTWGSNPFANQFGMPQSSFMSQQPWMPQFMR